MAACSRVQLDHQEDMEIRFQVAGYRISGADTKANTDYKTNYQSVPFGAYAWFKGDNPADDATFMTNQKVAYEATQNVWFTEGVAYYWPSGAHLISSAIHLIPMTEFPPLMRIRSHTTPGMSMRTRMLT